MLIINESAKRGINSATIKFQKLDPPSKSITQQKKNLIFDESQFVPKFCVSPTNFLLVRLQPWIQFEQVVQAWRWCHRRTFLGVKFPIKLIIDPKLKENY